MFRLLSLLMRSPLRIRILAYFFRRPDCENTVSDVASTLGTPRSSVSREISSLVRLGFLVQRNVKRVGMYRANMSYEMSEPLAHFLTVTSPEPKEVAQAFRGIRNIALLVMSGVLLNEDRNNVDLIVVGRNLNQTHIDRAVRKVEALVAMPLQYAVFTPEAFRERKEAHDRILRDTFEFKHEILIDKTAKY